MIRLIIGKWIVVHFTMALITLKKQLKTHILVSEDLQWLCNRLDSGFVAECRQETALSARCKQSS